MLRNNNDNKINSILGPEVEINGDINVTGSILIYGKINGHVTATGRVTMAKKSSIKGNIDSKDAIISGTIEGDLKVENKAILEDDCVLNGNLTASIIVVEEGATFEGLCNMLGAKSINNDNNFEASLANEED